MSNLKTGTPLSQEEAQKAFNTLKARGADPDIDPSHLAGHSGRPSGQYPHFKVGDIYIWVEPGVSISP